MRYGRVPQHLDFSHQDSSPIGTRFEDSTARVSGRPSSSLLSDWLAPTLAWLTVIILGLSIAGLLLGEN
jgi:hypothetical protein